VTAWSTEMTGMSASAASASASFTASGLTGFTMIASTSAAMRFRRSSSCPAASVSRWNTVSSATWPESTACALIEQIISSRQPLLVSVFDTPM
jgi:hypothetical protein